MGISYLVDYFFPLPFLELMGLDCPVLEILFCFVLF